jgi:cell division GTPase FtsZ
LKLMVIGCGQCGGRIADQFALLNKVSQVKRNVNIATNVIAVNTDVADLSGLKHIKADYRQRILIGGQQTGGHGVGKMNEIGAEVAHEDGDKVIEVIRDTKNFADTDAFLLIASAAGGTGSGAISVLTRMIKERHADKPVYNMIVLPFGYEEKTEERSIYNVGTCLKSSYLCADAIFLADNQRFVNKTASISSNLEMINYQMVKPFYNLLCAGEETNPKHIGSRVLDAGDIIQTLSGWTVIGYGSTQIPRLRFSFGSRSDFRGKSSANQKGTMAMDSALGDLSLKCSPPDARKALYLLTSPPEEMGMDLINELSTSLKSMATDAIIRSGDYPRGDRQLEVTVILSELVNSAKVMNYFTKAINYISLSKKRQGSVDSDQRDVSETFSDIPSLL